jgi:WD40 repeat protein
MTYNHRHSALVLVALGFSCLGGQRCFAQERKDTILQGLKDSVTCLALSPDGKLLATASHDKTLRVWDTAGGKELAVLKGHTSHVYSLALSPDGKTLASVGGWGDLTVKIWDVSTGHVG